MFRGGSYRTGSGRWDRTSTCSSPSTPVAARTPSRGCSRSGRTRSAGFGREASSPGSTTGPAHRFASARSSWPSSKRRWLRRALPAVSSIRPSGTSSSAWGTTARSRRSRAAPRSTVRPKGGGAWRRIAVDGSAGTITLPAGGGLDLGGIAKGMAVDASLDLLSALGADAALVSAGGDLAVRGLPPGRRAWPVLVGNDPTARSSHSSGVRSRRPVRLGAAGSRARSSGTTSSTPDGRARRGSGLTQVTVAGGTCRAAEVGATAAFVAGRRSGRWCSLGSGWPECSSRTPAGVPSGAGPGPGSSTPHDQLERRHLGYGAGRWAISYVLLTPAVSLGLVLRNRWQSTRWPRLVTNELHGYVSLLALAFIAVHVVAVAVDPFTQFGLGRSRADRDPLPPPLDGPRHRLAVPPPRRMGQRAVCVAGSGTRSGGVHVLAFAVYSAATLHGLGTGSDTRTIWEAPSTRRASHSSARYLPQASRAGGARRRRGPLVAGAAASSLATVPAWTMVGPLAPGVESLRAGGRRPVVPRRVLASAGHRHTLSRGAVATVRGRPTAFTARLPRSPDRAAHRQARDG